MIYSYITQIASEVSTTLSAHSNKYVVDTAPNKIIVVIPENEDLNSSSSSLHDLVMEKAYGVSGIFNNIDVVVKNSYSRDERTILANDNYLQYVASKIQGHLKDYKFTVNSAALVIEIPVEDELAEEVLVKVRDRVNDVITKEFDSLHEKIPVIVKMPYTKIGNFYILAF